jgi:hypothetical protein
MHKICYFVSTLYIFGVLNLLSGVNIKMFRAHNIITLRTYLVIWFAHLIFLVYKLHLFCVRTIYVRCAHFRYFL